MNVALISFLSSLHLIFILVLIKNKHLLIVRSKGSRAGAEAGTQLNQCLAPLQLLATDPFHLKCIFVKNLRGQLARFLFNDRRAIRCFLVELFKMT